MSTNAALAATSMSSEMKVKVPSSTRTSSSSSFSTAAMTQALAWKGARPEIDALWTDTGVDFSGVHTEATELSRRRRQQRSPSYLPPFPRMWFAGFLFKGKKRQWNQAWQSLPPSDRPGEREGKAGQSASARGVKESDSGLPSKAAGAGAHPSDGTRTSALSSDLPVSKRRQAVSACYERFVTQLGANVKLPEGESEKSQGVGVSKTSSSSSSSNNNNTRKEVSAEGPVQEMDGVGAVKKQRTLVASTSGKDAVAREEELKLLEPGYGVVVCTSGEGTGRALELDRAKLYRSVIGEDGLLAVASGVTVENVESYLPVVDIFLVGTGVEELATDPALIEFYRGAGLPPAVNVGTLDPTKVRILAKKIHDFN